MIIKLYTDAGHGWYAVKRELLNKLNIADKISCFSYQKSTMVYLEEDCDASILFEALDRIDAQFKVVIVHHDDRSVIRSYASYDKNYTEK